MRFYTQRPPSLRLGGVSHCERLARGEVLTTKDVHYLITVPSEKYAWLNSAQLIGKLVELKLGEGGYVKYDVFILR